MSKPHVLEFNNKNLYPKGPKLYSVTMVNIFLGLEVAFFNMNIKVVQEIRITFASCDEWFSCHLPFTIFIWLFTAFLDYYDIPYEIVEVNPLSKKEIKWSDYKKVPILMVDGKQLVDSSGIIVH